jgi:ubiquitin-protein ligase
MDVNNPLHWTANVVGVGKWKGRTYTVEIYLSKHYPRAVPKIKFISPINHPNIFLASDGWICLSTFDREIWRPTYNLSTIYESIQYIMKKPNYHRENRWNPAQHNNNYRGTMPEFERALRLRGARRTF